MRTNLEKLCELLFQRLAALLLAPSSRVCAVLLRTTGTKRRTPFSRNSIHLSVVARAENDREMIAFLDEFSSRLRLTRRLLPMLGEVEICSLQDFRQAHLVSCGHAEGLQGYRVLRLRALPEERRLLEEGIRASRGWRVERAWMRHLLSHYLYEVLPKLFPREKTAVGVGLRQSVQDAHALLSVIEGGAEGSFRADVASKEADVIREGVFSVFRKLTYFCSQCPPLGMPDVASCSSLEKTSLGASALRGSVSQKIADALPSQVEFHIWRSLAAPEKYSIAFVLPDHAGAEEFELAIEAISGFWLGQSAAWRDQFSSDPHQWNASETFPYLFSWSLWRIFCELYAFEGLAVSAAHRSRDVPQGSVAIAPSLEALVDHAAVQYNSWLLCRNTWVGLQAEQTPELLETLARTARIFSSVLRGRKLKQFLRWKPIHSELTAEELYTFTSGALLELSSAVDDLRVSADEGLRVA